MNQEIKKVLIKLPEMKNEMFLTFPFLNLISEEFPKAEINILIEEGELYTLQYLPFKVKALERPKNKRSLVETHHFVANTKDLNNIDIYFDLENSFNSAFIGFNFKAKERVGFEMGWNKHLLTKKFQNEFENNFEMRSIRLLENYLGKSFSDYKLSMPINDVVVASNVEPLFKIPDPPKFLMIMLDNFEKVSKEIDVWKNVFDSFEEQKFIIWAKEDEEHISELFAHIDLGKNELYMHRGAFPKELNYVIKKMTGVIANNVWAEAYCGHFNVPVITFVTEKTNLPQYRYFKFRPQRIIFDDNFANISLELEEKKFESINEVSDFIHFQFKL